MGELQYRYFIKTSVSETIRKVLLAKAQTALGKQEISSVECEHLSHCWNTVKTSSPHKISCKLGNWLLTYGQKTICHCGSSVLFWILKIVIFGHVTVVEFQICCCVPDFIKIRWFFIEIWWFTDFNNGNHPPFWIFEIWSLCYVTSAAVLLCLPVKNFTEIGKSAAELWPK